MKQKNVRSAVDVGGKLSQVSPVMYWYKNGHFSNDEEARGAFMLAYQQALDGMGLGIHQWMGISEEQLKQWVENRTLPKK